MIEEPGGVSTMLEIHAAGERCLCDFTFDFYWQHQGSRLDPDEAVSGISFRKMVEALRQGETVKIRGDAGSRLGSSLGEDLLRLGGNGGPIERTGSIIVDGDVGSHMGISMQRGAIYVAGTVKPPLGNVVSAKSDLSGYRKFVSITEVLEKGLSIMEPNASDEMGLIIADGILRDTLGARNPTSKKIRLKGNSGMSTGILMHRGSIEVFGDAASNTGVLLQGGRIIVHGNTGDFTGAEMRRGEIIVEDDAGGYSCARMKGGAVYARKGKPLPPARMLMPDSREQSTIAQALNIPLLHAMMYRKLCV
jgi:formylmethanofuran dehydrogenase subunit C